MADIKIDKLNKFYGSVQVIKDVSLEIKSQSFTVLVGPSGCGKSTMLRMIAGLEDINSGTISIDGQVVNDLPPKQRNIAMVFQSYALYPHMTVFDNMAFGLKIEKKSKDEITDRVMEAAKILQIEEYLERKPKQLSGGQRQRVAIGRAITRKPKVFLFDEPLSNLDAALRVQMRVELAKLHDQLNATMIYVTHDQSEALTMSNRIAVFNDGKVQQLSSPDELYEKPVNSFVAEFIGENNTFNGEVVDIDKDKCKVKLVNSEILANPISVKSKGDKTTVSLRPERALINPTDKMDNMFTGKIEEVIYHGDHTRVRLDLLGSSEFILKVPNSTSNLELKVKEDINIGWNSVDARALDPK